MHCKEKKMEEGIQSALNHLEKMEYDFKGTEQEDQAIIILFDKIGSCFHAMNHLKKLGMENTGIFGFCFGFWQTICDELTGDEETKGN
jgi:hypothetical protein